jgi:hypothetical protein
LRQGQSDSASAITDASTAAAHKTHDAIRGAPFLVLQAEADFFPKFTVNATLKTNWDRVRNSTAMIAQSIGRRPRNKPFAACVEAVAVRCAKDNFDRTYAIRG